MAKGRNYVYTDLSVKNSLTLEVEGAGEFDIVQFSSGWAASEIPTAAVMLAIGRNVRTGDKAAIHAAAGKMQQMQKAFVWFEPKGEYDQDRAWPAGRRKIFEGYFTGFAYRKVSGKVHVVCNLIHWLAALGFTSALTKNGHVSNPAALNAAAVLQSLRDSGAGGTNEDGTPRPGNLISLLSTAELCADTLSADLWVSLKSVFCALANTEAMLAGNQEFCGGDGSFQVNDVAQYALGKMEGPAPGCDVPYKWGVPLKLETEGVSVIEDAISMSIGNTVIESYSSTTLWDKLVAEFCPQYGMAVVPMVDSAIVVADLPAYRGGHWREISVNDYDSYDMSRELHRPLRGVGTVVGYESQTGVGVGGDELAFLGGCFAEDSVSPGDGVVMYVPGPQWLRSISNQPGSIEDSTRLLSEGASGTATTPGVGRANNDRDALGINANKLHVRYAQSVYVNQMLRGQSGSFSGKLRFDVAPLSIVKLNATAEKFIGPGQDDLAATLFGCVQRVTIAINAEAGMAGTTFQLSHVRTETENGLNRTSVEAHPLLGTSIHGGGKHGSPLVDDYEFPDPSIVPIPDGGGPTDVA